MAAQEPSKLLVRVRSPSPAFTNGLLIQAGHVSLLRQRGATFHFCPECGSTVYWDIAAAPELLGVAIGTFADPTFPPPMISGFAAEGAAWAMNVSELPMPGGRYDYDGTSHGGPRA
jgi:hypothetical protein